MTFFRYIALVMSTFCVFFDTSASAQFLSTRPCYLAGTVTKCFKPVNVAGGGTGAITLTSNGILLGAGTGAVTAIASDTTTTDILHGGNPPAFSQIVNADVSASAAIAGSKIAAATSALTGTVSIEEASSFSVTLTGPRSTTFNINYTHIGKMVTLYFPRNITGTCSNNFFSGTAQIATAALRPFGDLYFPMFSYDNAANQNTGYIQITSGGNIQIGKAYTGSAFTNGAACGWFETVVSYPTP